MRGLFILDLHNLDPNQEVFDENLNDHQGMYRKPLTPLTLFKSSHPIFLENMTLFFLSLAIS